MKAVDFIPVGLAIMCYVLAGLFKDTQIVMVPLVGLGGTLTGVALPQLSGLLQARRSNSQAGCTRVSIMVIFLVTAVATYVALVLNPPTVRAAESDTAGNYTIAWTVGATATTLDLKSGSPSAFDQGGTCLTLTYDPLHIGGDACVYTRLATKDLPNAVTPGLGFHYRNAGLVLGFKKQQDLPWTPVLLLTGQAALLGGL